MKELIRQYAGTAIAVVTALVLLALVIGNERGCGKGNSKEPRTV